VSASVRLEGMITSDKAKIATAIWAAIWMGVAFLTGAWIFAVVALPPFMIVNRYGRYLFATFGSGEASTVQRQQLPGEAEPHAAPDARKDAARR